MKILQDFKTFALRGNIMDMAVGVVVGGAFSKIVTSLVNDLVMPLISLVTGKMDFANLFIALDGNEYQTIDEAKTIGVATLNYGAFITTIIDFLIIAFSVFVVIRQINRVQERIAKAAKEKEAKNKPEEVPEEAPAPTTKECPFCRSDIHIEATKCPNCTSDLLSEKSDKTEPAKA